MYLNKKHHSTHNKKHHSTHTKINQKSMGGIKMDNQNRVTITLSREARNNITKVQGKLSKELSCSEEGGVRVNKGYAIAKALADYVKANNL